MPQTVSRYSEGSMVIDRFALPVLTPTQTILLRFVWLVSCRMRKHPVDIRQHEFIDGVDNTRIHVPGLPISQRTAISTVASLSDLGILVVTKHKIGHGIVVNSFEIDFNTLESNAMAQLKTPKRDRKQAETEAESPVSRCAKIAQGPVQNLHSNIYINNNKLNRLSKDNHRLPATDSIEATVTAVTTRVSVKREARAAKAASKNLTMHSLQVMWQSAVAQHYAAVTPEVLTKAAYGNFVRHLSILQEAGNLRDMLNYVAENWSTICNTRLGWVGSKGGDKMRPTPNLEQLGKFAKYFAQAYNDNATAAENEERKRTVDKEAIGLAEAKAELARRDAELAKVRARLKDTERIAYRKVSGGEPIVQDAGTLSDRIESARSMYNEDIDLKEWGDDT